MRRRGEGKAWKWNGIEREGEQGTEGRSREDREMGDGERREEEGEGRLNEVVQLAGETPRQTSDLSVPSSAASLTRSLRRPSQQGALPYPPHPPLLPPPHPHYNYTSLYGGLLCLFIENRISYTAIISQRLS